MRTVEHEAIVPYSADQMFALVNDVKRYPEFVPWCLDSRMIDQTEETLEAELSIGSNHLKKSFITKNDLYPHERIEINLVSGPFQSLKGAWRFQDLGPTDKPLGCRVHLYLAFEFASAWFDQGFSSVFNQVSQGLVNAFSERAHTIYR